MNFFLQPLTFLTFFPLVGVLVMLFIPRERKDALRWTALITSLITFGISLLVLSAFNPSDPDLQLVAEPPEASHHVVEVARQIRELVPRMDVDSRGRIAAADALDRADEATERSVDDRADRQPDERCHEPDGGGGDAEVPYRDP